MGGRVEAAKSTCTTPLPVCFTEDQLQRAVYIYSPYTLGRVTLNDPLQTSDWSSKGKSRTSSLTRKRPTHSQTLRSGRYTSRTAKLAPEEVLFRRRGAPTRYAEKDIYWANEDLPADDAGLRLPDSDLIKAIHGYASKFYETMAHRLGPSCVVGPRLVDECSMDETALLAFGILLDEAAREARGKKGDLVFTEGMVEDEDDDDKAAEAAAVAAVMSEMEESNRGRGRQRRSQKAGQSGDDDVAMEAGRPKKKRRKAVKPELTDDSGL